MEPGGTIASAANAQDARKRLIGWLLGLIALVAGILYFTEEPFLGRPQSPYSFLLVLVLTGAGFWYLVRGRFTVAVTIVNTCFFVAVAGPLLIHGLERAEGLLPLLFVPLSLSSLVLTRRNTIINAAATVIVFLGSLVLQQSGVTGDPDGLSPSELATAVQFTIAFVVLSLILDRFGRTTSAALALSQSRERALVAEMEQRRDAEDALQDERNFSDAIIAGLPGVFIVLDEHDNVLRGNDTIAEATGYGQEQLDGMPVHAFINPEEWPFVAKLVSEIRSKGHGEATIRLKRADGALVPYLFHARSFIMDKRPYVVALGYDVSQAVEAERNIQELNEHLEQRIERLTALHRIDRVVSQDSGPAATIEVVLEQVTTALGVDAAAIQRYEATSGELTWQLSRGIQAVADRLSRHSIRLGEGASGRAAQQRQPLYLHGRSQLQKHVLRWDDLRDERFEFYAAVPLFANAELEGVLNLFHRTDFEPDEEWRDFLDSLASHAALALSKARLLEHLQATNLELRQAYDTTIEGWSRALDLRDEETEGHSQRVTELTLELVRRMGASADRLEHIRRGALLHDIGKMGVPDSILLKPGRLTAEERRVMEQHPEFAWKLLQPIEFLRPALAIPYSHHENWDGSGYPQGLAGEDIPLSARVFAVVDVYDALTSDRPYREAWLPEEALAHIRKQAGRKFDPNVVEQFSELMQETSAHS